MRDYNDHESYKYVPTVPLFPHEMLELMRVELSDPRRLQETSRQGACEDASEEED
jgi:hypothetical protein